MTPPRQYATLTKAALARLGNRPGFLAILSALLALAAFPPLEWHGAAWVALAPLVAGLGGAEGYSRSHSRSRSSGWAGGGAGSGAGSGGWLAGWGFGLVYFAAQFAWLHRALVELAGMPFFEFAGFLALVTGALALVPAAVCGLSRWGWIRFGIAPFWSFPPLFAAQDLLLGYAPFGGVAWGSLAGTQPHTLAARWIVPWLGGAGLVLLIAFVNAGWAALGRQALLDPGTRDLPGTGGARNGRTLLAGGNPAARMLAVPLLAVTLLSLWPAPIPHAPDAASTGASLTALIVPGGLTLSELEAEGGTAATLRYYLERTLAAAVKQYPVAFGGGESAKGGDPASANPATPRPATPIPAHPGLVVWPESAVAGYVAAGQKEEGDNLTELSRVGELLEADILVGSNAREQGRDRNALYLIALEVPGAPAVRRYDKRRLVPFGEYVPAGFRWLMGSRVTTGESDYESGSGPPVLPGQGGLLGLAICFESILPAHAEEMVRSGAQVLVVAANDVWLTPAARLQHLRLTALRGLEAGRDVLLAANQGWSAHLRGGRVLASAPPGGAPFAVRAALRSEQTPWMRFGVWSLATAMALAGLAGWVLRRRGDAQPAAGTGAG